MSKKIIKYLKNSIDEKGNYCYSLPVETTKAIIKEINRLNNIINGFDEWLLGEQMMFYKSNDGERLIRYGETTNKWLKLKALKEE